MDFIAYGFTVKPTVNGADHIILAIGQEEPDRGEVLIAPEQVDTLIQWLVRARHEALENPDAVRAKAKSDEVPR